MTNESTEIETRTTLLHEVLQMVWRRAWLVCACLVVSLAAGWAYYQQAEPIYQVRARLLVEHEVLPLEGRQSRTRFEEEFIATQAQIVSSPAVVGPVVEAIGWTPELPGQDPTESILDCLTVKPIAGTNVLDISFRNTRTIESIDAVDAIIGSYRDYLGKLDQDAFQETLTLLTTKERETREELESLEDEYRKLRERGLIVGIGMESQHFYESALVDLTRELTEVKNRRIELENGLGTLAKKSSSKGVLRLASGNEAGMPVARPAILHVDEAEAPEPTDEDLAILVPLMNQLQIEGYRSLESMKQKRFEALDRQKKFSKIYSPSNVTMVALYEEIEAWDVRIREQREALPAILEMELKSIRDREANLAILVEEEMEKAKRLDLHMLKESQAVSRVERVQAAHDSILSQLKQLELKDAAAANGQSDVRVTVLAVPEMSESPVWPSRTIVFGIFGLIGVAAGFGIVVVTEQTRTVA